MIRAVKSGGWESATLIHGDFSTTPIDALLEKFTTTAAGRGLRPRSITEITKSLRSIAGALGAKRIGQLTPQRAQEWVTTEVASGANPATVRSKIKAAACVFARASLRAMNLTAVNPFRDIAKPRVETSPFKSPPREWITSLMATGLAELNGDQRRAFALALGAGLRWGEIITLEWSNVTSDGVRIESRFSKSRRERIVPLGPAAKAALEADRQPAGTVIAGNCQLVHDNLCLWLRAHAVNDQKPCHYLRKCFGSLAVHQSGLFIASRLLGHAKIEQTASAYAGAVEKLPSVNF